jgi:hypothetical protein
VRIVLGGKIGKIGAVSAGGAEEMIDWIVYRTSIIVLSIITAYLSTKSNLIRFTLNDLMMDQTIDRIPIKILAIRLH